MTTNLQLTPLPDLAAVRVELTGAAAGPAAITRTDANGSRLVRQRAGQETSAGSLVVVDYEPALTGDVVYTVAGTRTNEIANPSYEANVSGWNAGGGRLTFARWTDPTAPEGTYYMRATANVAIGTSSGYIYPVSSPAAGGQPWSAVVYVRPSVAGNHKLQVRGMTAGAYTTPYIEGAATFCPAGVWTRVEASGVLPAGCDAVLPMLFCLPTMNVGDYFEVDAFQLIQEAAPGPYVEGTVSTTIPASTSLAGQVAGPVVASVVAPAQRAEAELLQDYAETYAGRSTVLQVIGRDDAIPLLGPAARRVGEAGLLVETYPAAQAIVAAVRPGSVVMFRQLDYAGMDAYAIVTSSRVAPTLTELDEPRWLATLGYLAVPAPDDALAGDAAWTYADVVELGVTYAELSALFDTYYELAVGA